MHDTKRHKGFEVEERFFITFWLEVDLYGHYLTFRCRPWHHCNTAAVWEMQSCPSSAALLRPIRSSSLIKSMSQALTSLKGFLQSRPWCSHPNCPIRYWTTQLTLMPWAQGIFKLSSSQGAAEPHQAHSAHLPMPLTDSSLLSPCPPGVAPCGSHLLLDAVSNSSVFHLCEYLYVVSYHSKNVLSYVIS